MSKAKEELREQIILLIHTFKTADAADKILALIPDPEKELLRMVEDLNRITKNSLSITCYGNTGWRINSFRDGTVLLPGHAIEDISFEQAVIKAHKMAVAWAARQVEKESITTA